MRDGGGVDAGGLESVFCSLRCFSMHRMPSFCGRPPWHRPIRVGPRRLRCATRARSGGPARQVRCETRRCLLGSRSCSTLEAATSTRVERQRRRRGAWRCDANRTWMEVLKEPESGIERRSGLRARSDWASPRSCRILWGARATSTPADGTDLGGTVAAVGGLSWSGAISR